MWQNSKLNYTTVDSDKKDSSTYILTFRQYNAMVAMVHVSIVCTNLPKSLKSLKSQMKMVLNMILLA